MSGENWQARAEAAERKVAAWREGASAGYFHGYQDCRDGRQFCDPWPALDTAAEEQPEMVRRETAERYRARAETAERRVAVVLAHRITLHDTIGGLRWSCTCRATGAGELVPMLADADDHLRAALDTAEDTPND